MHMRSMCSAFVAIIVAAGISAQTSGQLRAETAAQVGGAAGEITLVGCIQREADYRRQHDLGRGGVAGTGLGRGNEYILANPIRPGSGAAASELDCGTIAATSGAPGEAYELTGPSERELEPYVGRKVAVTGMLKNAETQPEAVGTSGGGVATPTGGFDPLGQDLRLFELEMTSFREVVAVAEDHAGTPAANAPQAPSEPNAIGTTGTQESQAPTAVAEDRLPTTASPLPITGLLGLLSIGGALAVRARRRSRT